MKTEHIVYAYQKLVGISYSIREYYPDWTVSGRYFAKAYSSLKGIVGCPVQVRDFIEKFAVEGSRVPEELSLADFLRQVAEWGKKLPEDYDDLRMLAETAEKAAQAENIYALLENEPCVNTFVGVLFCLANRQKAVFYPDGRFQKINELKEMLDVLTCFPVELPEAFCRQECQKMVKVVTDFYHECLAEGRYDDFTTFFVIYCLHYIRTGLIHQLNWSEKYLFGVPKSLFAGADERLLPYLEKTCEGILWIYNEWSFVNYEDFGEKFNLIFTQVSKDFYREPYGKDWKQELVKNISELPEELGIFQKAIDIWSDMPIAHYYCFIFTVARYFTVLRLKENYFRMEEERIQFLKEENFSIERELSEIEQEIAEETDFERLKRLKESMSDCKKQLAEAQKNHNELLALFPKTSHEDLYIETMLDAYEKMPEMYHNFAIGSGHHMLPSLVFQGNMGGVVPEDSDFEKAKAFYSNEDYYRLGMAVNVQYPDKLVKILLNDKQQLRQKNKELEQANTDLLQAQDDRKQVINEFSHTYSNMKATTLYDIGQNLLKAASEDFRYYGRLALIEYGIKENLTKEVQLLKLRFEDNMQELLQNIRNTVLLQADGASVQIQDIVSDAWKRCFMTLLYDETTKGKDWCNFFFGKQQHDMEKIRLRDDFEESVLVKSGRYSTAAWLEQSRTILFSLSVSGEWEKFYFKADDFAALLLTDWISELFTNVIRYADRKQPVTMEFSSSGDILRISLQNQKNAIRVHNTRIGMTSMQSYLQKLNESTGYSGASMQITDEENAYQIELFLNGKIFH